MSFCRLCLRYMLYFFFVLFVFLFKQNTEYDMRISDWSSDVCSSDLTPQAGEIPAALVARLALAKSEAVAGQEPGAWVIGSDQVAELDGAPLGKPGDRRRAIAQLASMSGRAVAFRTAVAVVEIGRESCRERVCQYV